MHEKKSNASPATAGYVDSKKIEAELLSVRPVVEAGVGLHKFPLGKLEPREFELLLYRLFNTSAPPSPISKTYDHVRVLNDGQDRGRDVVLYGSEKAVGIIQCKRHNSNISLPEVFREIIRFILFAHLSPELIPAGSAFQYILALAQPPAETAADLFSEPERIVADNDHLIEGYVQDVIKKYESFRGLRSKDVLPEVKNKLCSMSLRLLSETELNLWLLGEQETAQIFFPARLVIDDAGFMCRVLPAMRDMMRSPAIADPGTEFAQWRAMTDSATRQANVVTTKRNKGQKEPVTLKTVYVTRTIEEDILKWVDRYSRSGGLVAVIGPAGYGKTSLLWRLQEKLNESGPESCIALTPTDMLRLVASDDFHQRTLRLVEHAKKRAQSQQSTYILLDTFDVLAHDPAVKDATIGFVSHLTAAGATVLLSSRPEEISKISLDDISPQSTRLYIEKYDEREFADAANNYCRAFYEEKAQGNLAEKHAAQLIRAVTQKRPIREICLGPLTLRMLFELYAPDEIPPNANAFGLYGSYWISKVQDDARVGGISASAARIDLTETVMTLAAAMMGGGAPSLTSQKKNLLVSNNSLDAGNVSELVNRNLLIEGPSGSLEFFHQTFFEYAAAKAMAAHGADVAKIANAVLEHKENYFLLPVYEQVLLILAETRPEQWTELDAFAGQFVQDGHPALVNCGMYLHMFSSRGCTSVAARLIVEIERGKKSLLRLYVQLLPNLQPDRAGEVIDVLKAAWKRSGWEFIEPAVNLLAWLSKNDWSGCKRFMTDFDAVRVLYASGASAAPIDRILIDILSPGLDDEPAWVVDRLIEHRRGSYWHPLVLDFIASNPSVIASWPAKKINWLIEELYEKDDQPAARPARTSSPRLLAVLWSEHPGMAPSDISTIGHLPANRLKLTLRALAHPEYALPAGLLLRLAAECRLQKQAAQLHTFLNSFAFVVLANRTGHNVDKYPAVEEAVIELLEQFASAYHGIDHVIETPRNRVIARFCQRLFVSGISIDRMSDLLQQIGSEQWLSLESINSLFPVALHLHMPHAVEAFERVCAEPLSFKPVIKRLGGTLRGFEFSETHLSVVLRLAIASGNPGPVLDLLRDGLSTIDAPALGSALAPVSAQLLALQDLMLRSDYRGPKTVAYELLARLMELGVLPTMPVDAVSEVMAQAGGNNKKVAAIPLLERAAQAGEPNEAIKVLLDLGTPLGHQKQKRIVQALHVILQPERAVPPADILCHIAAFGFQRIENEPRAHLVGKIVWGYCQVGDTGAANATALQLLRNTDIRSMGTTQKRTLAHHLDKTFQLLFSRLNTEQIAPYIAELEDGDAHLGRLTVVALCKSRRADIQAHLQAILASQKIDQDLKRVVQGYRRFGLANL